MRSALVMLIQLAVVSAAVILWTLYFRRRWNMAVGYALLSALVVFGIAVTIADALVGISIPCVAMCGLLFGFPIVYLVWKRASLSSKESACS